MIYTLNNGVIAVKVDSNGAELRSVIKNGKEMIWQNDNGEWSGSAPVLFPWCGSVNVIVYGRKYPFIQHGVASLCSFALTDSGDNYIRLSATSSKETKKYYPFNFIFDVVFTIEEDTLKIDYEVINPSDEYIYFGIGAHESYNTFGALEDCVIEFEKSENFVNHIHHPEKGVLTGATENLGSGSVLDFEKIPLVNDLTFIFKDINSRKVLLKKKTGERIAETTFNGFNNLLFWRPGDGKVVCIEPWNNLPSYDGVDKELSEHYGVEELACGQKKTFSRTIKYYAE